MGNSSSTSTSKQTKEALLNFDHGEVEALKKNYQRLASSTAPKGLISVEALSTELHISEWLAANLMRALQDAANPTLGPSKRAESVIGFERFVVSLTLCCSSTQSDRRDFALLALSGDGGSVSKETVRAILEETIKKTLPHDTPKRPALLQDVLDDAVKASFERQGGGESMSSEQVAAWFQEDQGTAEFISLLMRSHFLRDYQGAADMTRKLPLLSHRSQMLQPRHMYQLGAHLPSRCAERPWKKLFSMTKHGQSFSSFMNRILFRGPTVVLVRDEAGHVFGFFASHSWHKANKFYGDMASFVFSIVPTFKIFRSSNVNNNFQWLSTSLTSCNNGLGVGGQKDHWGIHLSMGLEEGTCRAPCSTFEKFPCLSALPQFKVDHVEAWGCIPDYEPDEAELEEAGLEKKPIKNWEQMEARDRINSKASSGKGSRSRMESYGTAGSGGGSRDLESRVVLEATGLGDGGRADNVRAADEQLTHERK
ncbi:TLD-domain-containing protein, partial [Baffinella frigidus]